MKVRAFDPARLVASLDDLAAASVRGADGMRDAAASWNDFCLEWARWKMQFCATATDAEAREADRLFFPPETHSSLK